MLYFIEKGEVKLVISCIGGVMLSINTALPEGKQFGSR